MLSPKWCVEYFGIDKLFHVHPFIDHHNQRLIKTVLKMLFILQLEQGIDEQFNAEYRVLFKCVIYCIFASYIFLIHVHNISHKIKTFSLLILYLFDIIPSEITNKPSILNEIVQVVVNISYSAIHYFNELCIYFLDIRLNDVVIIRQLRKYRASFDLFAWSEEKQ